MSGLRDLPITVTLPISPAYAMELWDWAFWGAIGLGWTISYFFNPQAIYDNNITRTFKVLNVCVGFDFEPARPFVTYLFLVAWPLYALAVWGRWLKISYGKGGQKTLRKGLLIVSMLSMAVFVFCLTVPPFSYPEWQIHVGAFGVALFGWSLFKLLGVVEYFSFDGRGGFFDEDFDGVQDPTATVYIWTLIIHGLIMFAGGCLMILRALTLPVENFVAVINDNVIPPEYTGGLQVIGEINFLKTTAMLVYPDGTEEPIGFDWIGNFLVLATMIALPLQSWTIPNKLKHIEIADAKFERLSAP